MATEAFGEFLDGRRLSKNQIPFIHMILSGLTRNRATDEDLLCESPSTDVAPEGPDGLFAEADVDSMVAILRSVRANATPPAPEVA